MLRLVVWKVLLGVLFKVLFKVLLRVLCKGLPKRCCCFSEPLRFS